jgi:type VI secretion system secreted protein VgrG
MPTADVPTANRMRVSVLKQEGRVAKLTTPLGEDTLVLTRFDGDEGVSELFEYRIEALTDKEDINWDDAIGKACSVTFKNYGKERVFNGILIDAQWLGIRGNAFQGHRLILRPWPWMLSRTSDCCFWLDRKPDEIIKDVFSKRGFNDHQFKLTESYPKLEFCVQYRETDLAFVSRLMEQYGIYYYFEHTSDKHMMILADSKSSLKPIPGGKVPFIALVGDDRRMEEHIYHVSAERRFRTGKVEVNDYDMKKPSANMLADKKGDARYARADMEIFDDPGKYVEQDDGKRYAKICLEAEQALDHRRYTNGDAMSLLPGCLVNMEKHWKKSENDEYLILRATHAYENEFYRTSGSEGGPGEIYNGTYELLPSKIPYRAPLATPKPRIYGAQTAQVVGPSGEEIHTDKYGRIKVRFFWDRKKKESCWIRVAHLWSGKTWGTQFIPRIGMEVVVDFMDGDPDRPLVVGTVYNEEYKHPYELPANKTQSGTKTNSSKGGGGYNEIMYEDKKGSEKIGVHAQKDLDVVVHNVETRKIGEDGVMGASRSTTLLTGDDELKLLTGGRSVTVMKSHDTTATMNISETATMNIMETATMNITNTANLLITLTCGASSIIMTPMSITISSPTVAILAPMGVAIKGATVPVAF